MMNGHTHPINPPRASILPDISETLDDTNKKAGKLLFVS